MDKKAVFSVKILQFQAGKTESIGRAGTQGRLRSDLLFSSESAFSSVMNTANVRMPCPARPFLKSLHLQISSTRQAVSNRAFTPGFLHMIKKQPCRNRTNRFSPPLKIVEYPGVRF
ncbi:hypothetical protein X474_27000 [Dethiosulfatarculus sandiegensis]|uniref:Uncharacterized protein n=1 Tax=Dethiosulfatarculus sandiegensis TaxID=1429043 RepID=A0A0D2HK52_9BACT|nr:hypothetical protein X474_27000 [Dethiosulfatarculus sandiegensis]